MKRQATILSIISFYTFLLVPLAPALAQNVTLPEDSDITAPLIRHEDPTRKVKPGISLDIQAVVTDDNQVDKVMLFFRAAGKTKFNSMQMKPQGDDFYMAIIPRDKVAEPGMEYYIQATDKAGNVVLRGFESEPLKMVVTEDATEVQGAGPALAKPWYKKWWAWTLAGAAVVGGTALAISIIDGGPNGPPPPDTTGSATITGPVP